MVVVIGRRLLEATAAGEELEACDACGELLAYRRAGRRPFVLCSSCFGPSGCPGDVWILEAAPRRPAGGPP